MTRMTRYWVREINVCGGRYAEVVARSASDAVRELVGWPITRTWRGIAHAENPTCKHMPSDKRPFVRAEPLAWFLGTRQ